MMPRLNCILVVVVLCTVRPLAHGASKEAHIAVEPAEHVVTIIEFADFQCPFCATQAPDLRKLQREYPNKVQVLFKNFPLQFHSRAKAAHLAAFAAGEQGKFWEMHDLIFSHPDRLSDADLEQYAEQLGLNKDRFRSAVQSNSARAALENDIAEGQKLGINGTPTLIVNGHRIEGLQNYDHLKRVVEAELHGQSWPDDTTIQNSGTVQVQTTEAPFLGSSSAPVTIVEFSDFQCPFCARAVPALERLVAENPGKIKVVYKNFPLDFHPDSFLAHRAAAAAGQQGKFWEMHHLIFENQHSIKRDDLIRFAVQLKLDMQKFMRDLDDSALAKRIEADKEEGTRLGVSGTPTFVVNGKMASGFSEPEFRSMIARELPNTNATTSADLSIPAVSSVDLTMGPKDAPITIQWFVDLGSPLSASSAVALQHYVAAHHGMTQVQFRNFPLPNRQNSMLLHEFVLAAAAQGRFWQAESLLLVDPKPKDRSELRLLASQLGLNQEILWQEIDANKYASVISRDVTSAREWGVTGSPTFVVGGRKLDGVNGLELLSKN
jgi:protein-disulfide isomerase